MEKKFSPEQEFQLSPLYPIIRDEWGKNLELQQGSKEGEMFVEAIRKDNNGNTNGKIKTTYDCTEGKRIGLHLEIDLKPKESIVFDEDGREERIYVHEYEQPEGNGAGDYAHIVSRKDVKTGDIFQDQEKWKIENGRFYPLGESFRKNDILLSSKEYKWNKQGDLTSIEVLENDSSGNLLSHTKSEIQKEINSVKEYQKTSEPTGWEQKGSSSVNYDLFVSQVWGRIANRITTAK